VQFILLNIIRSITGMDNKVDGILCDMDFIDCANHVVQQLYGIRFVGPLRAAGELCKRSQPRWRFLIHNLRVRNVCETGQ